MVSIFRSKGYTPLPSKDDEDEANIVGEGRIKTFVY